MMEARVSAFNSSVRADVTMMDSLMPTLPPDEPLHERTSTDRLELQPPRRTAKLSKQARSRAPSVGQRPSLVRRRFGTVAVCAVMRHQPALQVLSDNRTRDRRHRPPLPLHHTPYAVLGAKNANFQGMDGARTLGFLHELDRPDLYLRS